MQWNHICVQICRSVHHIHVCACRCSTDTHACIWFQFKSVWLFVYSHYTLALIWFQCTGIRMMVCFYTCCMRVYSGWTNHHMPVHWNHIHAHVPVCSMCACSGWAKPSSLHVHWHHIMYMDTCQCSTCRLKPYTHIHTCMHTGVHKPRDVLIWNSNFINCIINNDATPWRVT